MTDGSFFSNGLGVTLKITLIAIVIGIIIGIVLATIRSTYDLTKDEMRGFKKGVMTFLNAIAKVYLTVIRGTPVVITASHLFISLIFASSDNGVCNCRFGFRYKLRSLCCGNCKRRHNVHR